ncbi:hypothetical protein MMC13_001584 [Lambiella insularis]|nr:hypothetical protein [Lambiella insularis]
MNAVALLALLLALPLATAQNTVYYPQQVSPSPSPSLTVTAGDTINITWSLTYSAVDLRIAASGPHSNFSLTPFYNPALPPVSFFPYTLQPRDYQLNDSSVPISAYFILSDHLDATQFVRTENFTIVQPVSEVYVDGLVTVPPNAATWTGSVTLYSSIGIGVGSASMGAATPTSVTLSQTSTATVPAATTTTSEAPPSAAVSLAPASATATTAAFTSAPAGLDAGAKAGMGVGITLGILLLGGLALAAFLLLRKKRRDRVLGSGKSTGQPMVFEPESKIPQGGDRTSGSRLYEMEEGRPVGGELHGDRPVVVELGAGERRG